MTQHYRWHSVGIFGFALLGVASCGSETGEREEALLAGSPLVGEPARKWSTTTIPVCFTNLDGTEASAQEVRDLAMTEYSKTGLCLVGWGRCTASTPCPAVRIAIDGGDANFCGSGAYGCSPIGPGWCDGKPTLWLMDRAPEYHIIHELAHTLGFSHEHERADRPATDCSDNAPPESKQLKDGVDGIEFVTEYDKESTTSYCRKSHLLSALDIVGIQKFYATSGPVNCGTGGALGTGGATSTGGATAKGGTTSTGGTTANGGPTSTGGTTANGGLTSTGGTTNTGGISSVGGIAAASGGTTTTATAGGTTGLGLGGAATLGGASAASGATVVGGDDGGDEGGCSCRVPAGGSSNAGSIAALGAILLGLRRRRRAVARGNGRRTSAT